MPKVGNAVPWSLKQADLHSDLRTCADLLRLLPEADRSKRLSQPPQCEQWSGVPLHGVLWTLDGFIWQRQNHTSDRCPQLGQRDVTNDVHLTPLTPMFAPRTIPGVCKVSDARCYGVRTLVAAVAAAVAVFFTETWPLCIF